MPAPDVQKIGKYEILAELGQGGFGRVYRAFDPTVGRPVAIKILTTEGNRDLLTRFRNEATAAGNLRHRNIVTVYDYGEYNGRPYLVMELLEGEDLTQVIVNPSQLTLLQKMEIMDQVAAGLDCAHRNGVLHRDVKPANIRILPDGTVKIMDFGIARVNNERNATRLTQQGDLIGTILYMSPEQFGGAEADALCDIFAYGVIYFELLTGKHPFRSSDPRAVMFKITMDDPESIRGLAPECPEALERILYRALHKERELRYQNLRDLQLDAEPLMLDLKQAKARELVADAQRRSTANESQSALRLINEALDLDPSNRDARLLRENVQYQLQREAIQPRIESMLQTAQEQLLKRSFMQAVQTLESALKLDPADDRVRALLESAREQMRRAKDAARLVSNALVDIERGEWLSASAKTLEAARLDPLSADLARVRGAFEKHVSGTLAEIAVHMEHGELDLAIGALVGVDALQPESPAIQTKLTEARALQAERERTRAAIQKAKLAVDQSQFDEALNVLSESGIPDEPAVLALRERAQAGKAARERELSIQRTVLACTQLRHENRLEEALASVEAALKEYSGESLLLDLKSQLQADLDLERQAEAIRQMRATGRELLARGNPAQAAEHLDRATRQYPEDRDLQQLLAEARASLAAQQAAAESGRRVGQHDFAGAIQVLENTLAAWPRERELEDLLRSTRDAQTRWNLEQARLALEQQCDELIHSQRLVEALDVIREGLNSFPDAPGLVARRNQLQKQLELQGRVRIISEAIEQARHLMEQDDDATAIDVLTRARDLDPDSPEVGPLLALARRRKAVAEALADSQRRLDQQDFSSAIGLLEAALKEWPDENVLRESLEKIREAHLDWKRRQTVDGLAQKSRDLARSHRYEDALNVIQAGLTKYPGEPVLSDLRHELELQWEAEQRANAVRTALEEGRALLRQERPDQAVGVLEGALSQYPDTAELKHLLLEAQAALALQQRRDAIRDVLAAGQRKRDSENFAQAIAILDDALKLWPGEAVLLEFLQKTRDAQLSWERQRTVVELAREVSTLARQNRHSEALELVKNGLPELLDLQRQLQEELARRQRAADIERILKASRSLLKKGQLNQALATLEGAGANYPGDAALTQLLADTRGALQLQRKREEVEHAAREAQNRVQQQNFSGAIEILTGTLKAWPDDERLAALLKDTRQAWEQRQRQEAIRATAQQAEDLSGENRPGKALKIVEAALRQYGPDPSLMALQQRLLATIKLAPARTNRVVLAGGVAVLALAAAIVVPRFFHSGPVSIPLAIESNQSGATISVAGQSCVMPDCTLQLPPGEYKLVAVKNGFGALERSLSLKANSGNVKVPLVFTPLPQRIQVNTNFTAGKIFLDDMPAVDLRDGQFSLDAVPSGSHTIRITGGDAEFEADWKGEPGALPQLIRPITAKNVQATLLANAGENGTLACNNCDAGSIQVDGKALASSSVATGSSRVVNYLKEGSRRITIADRSLVVDVRPNPTLNIFLSLDRNVGTLVVETGQDNARVYINGQPYRRLTEHGILRLPVDVGEYAIRVEKAGFRSPAEAKADVRKGEEKQISLALTPLPASLEITGALPGTIVRLDGKALGEIASTGTLRTDIAPGEHQVELTKDNYNPSRFTAQFAPGQATRLKPEQVTLARVIPPSPRTESKQIDPRQAEEQDWEKIRSSNSPDDIEDFLRKHSASTHADAARLRISQLRQQLQADAARQAEQAAWDSLDKTKKATLQDFVGRYGSGAHQQEARALIAEMDKRESDGLAAARAAAAAEQQKRDELKATVVADQQAVARTVGQYEAAYNARDLKALESIWRGMPKAVSNPLASQFRDSKGTVFQLKPVATPVVSGDSATVICTRSLDMTIKDGQQFRSGNERVQVTLDRAGAGWVIRSIAAN